MRNQRHVAKQQDYTNKSVSPRETRTTPASARVDLMDQPYNVIEEKFEEQFEDNFTASFAGRVNEPKARTLYL